MVDLFPGWISNQAVVFLFALCCAVIDGLYVKMHFICTGHMASGAALGRQSRLPTNFRCSLPNVT